VEDPGPSFHKLLETINGREAVPELDRTLLAAEVPHGTTIVAFRYADGVLIAGDRRATAGNIIASRRIEKVFAADRYSAVGFAGSAGPAMELVRLFQVQLEHYEKVEGVTLSLEGKANQLSQMIRANMPMAMQGLVVVPIYVGWDFVQRRGRIFSFDITGGRYEEVDYHAIGSGGRDAASAVKLGFRDGLTRDEALDLAISGLFHAAQEDSATGGPDFLRSLFPVVATVSQQGYRRLDDAEVEAASSRVVEAFKEKGPRQ
jgi:proteasome beta subunit